MPIYEYACLVCECRYAFEEAMLDAHVAPTCSCGAATRRIWSHAFHCDEIRSTRYLDPDRRAWRTDHGREFNLGLGEWVSCRSEARAIAKAKGLVEVGNDYASTMKIAKGSLKPGGDELDQALRKELPLSTARRYNPRMEKT